MVTLATLVFFLVDFCHLAMKENPCLTSSCKLLDKNLNTWSIYLFIYPLQRGWCGPLFYGM
jgi:hypothetical protein